MSYIEPLTASLKGTYTYFQSTIETIFSPVPLALFAGSFGLLAYYRKPIATRILPIAVERTSVKVVNLLLRLGAKPENSLISSPIQDSNSIPLLIKAGIDLNHPNQLGQTPIHLASKNPDPNHLKQLMLESADLKAQDIAGDTPLHLAARANLPENIYTLSDAGADLEATTGDQHTALHLAANYGNLNALIALIDEKGKVEAKTEKNGYTPLHIAVLSNHPDTILELKNAGADFNAKTKDGDTPLHLAVTNRKLRSLKTLIKCGANIEERNGCNDTPLHHAIDDEDFLYPDAVKCLVHAGASIFTRNVLGETAIGIIWRTRNFSLLKPLMAGLVLRQSGLKA